MQHLVGKHHWNSKIDLKKTHHTHRYIKLYSTVKTNVISSISRSKTNTKIVTNYNVFFKWYLKINHIKRFLWFNCYFSSVQINLIDISLLSVCVLTEGHLKQLTCTSGPLLRCVWMCVCWLDKHSGWGPFNTHTFILFAQVDRSHAHILQTHTHSVTLHPAKNTLTILSHHIWAVLTENMTGQQPARDCCSFRADYCPLVVVVSPVHGYLTLLPFLRAHHLQIWSWKDATYVCIQPNRCKKVNTQQADSCKELTAVLIRDIFEVQSSIVLCFNYSCFSEVRFTSQAGPKGCVFT